MGSQNASVNLLGRGGSGLGVGAGAGKANGEADSEFNRALEISIEHLAAFGERFDAVQARRVADAGRSGNFYRALSGDFDLRLDDVFGPVAAAGGNIAGQREIRQRGHGEVVRAPDAGFQHASAPDWNGFLLAEIVDPAGGCVASDAAEFHIDDFAGADFDGGPGMLDIVNAFVEA